MILTMDGFVRASKKTMDDSAWCMASVIFQEPEYQVAQKKDSRGKGVPEQEV